MDWNFKPERRMSWEQIAEAIHDSVTIEEVLRYYIPGINIRGSRCPCPIHHGKDLNFSFTRTGFKCFVCGEGGDVVTLVKEVRELSTRADAMRMIDRDFNLHLDLNGEMKVNPDVLSRLTERQKEAQKLEAEQSKWEAEYNRLTAEYCILDDIVMHSQQISAIEQAKQRREIVKYLIEHFPIEPKKRG